MDDFRIKLHQFELHQPAQRPYYDPIRYFNLPTLPVYREPPPVFVPRQQQVSNMVYGYMHASLRPPC